MQPRAALAALVVALACSAPSGPVATVHTKTGPVPHGMLFVFDDVSDHSFWMKNTIIPLDMLFIGADQVVVGVHANATPLSLVPISVGRPSKWVLEVAGGYAGRAGIGPGDRIDLDRLR